MALWIDLKSLFIMMRYALSFARVQPESINKPMLDAIKIIASVCSILTCKKFTFLIDSLNEKKFVFSNG